MKTVIVLFALFLGVWGQTTKEYCTNELVSYTESKNKNLDQQVCNSKYGCFENNDLIDRFQRYANLHLQRSFEFLHMSTLFSNFEKNRPGFHKIMREMSDATWEDSFELIKYITKRGAVMDFNKLESGNDVMNVTKYLDSKLTEIQSITLALDIHKELAEKAFDLYRHAHGKDKHVADADVKSFIEEKFAEKHAEKIRKLAGHVTELQRLSKMHEDGALAIYIFDEHLQK